VLDKIDYLVHYKRPLIYISIVVITIISFWGLTMVKPIGYVVDDLPKNDPVIEHLRFFEKNFNGVLPFEFYIDTKKRNGVFADNAKVLYKIKALEKVMSIPITYHVGRPIRIELKYFLKRFPLEKSIKKFPLETLAN